LIGDCIYLVVAKYFLGIALYIGKDEEKKDRWKSEI